MAEGLLVRVLLDVTTGVILAQEGVKLLAFPEVRPLEVPVLDLGVGDLAREELSGEASQSEDAHVCYATLLRC